MPFPIGSLTGAIERGINAFNAAKDQRLKEDAAEQAKLESKQRIKASEAGIGISAEQEKRAARKAVDDEQTRKMQLRSEIAIRLANGDPVSSSLVGEAYAPGAELFHDNGEFVVQASDGAELERMSVPAVHKYAERIQAEEKAKIGLTRERAGYYGRIPKEESDSERDLRKAQAGYYREGGRGTSTEARLAENQQRYDREFYGWLEKKYPANDRDGYPIPGNIAIQGKYISVYGDLYNPELPYAKIFGDVIRTMSSKYGVLEGGPATPAGDVGRTSGLRQGPVEAAAAEQRVAPKPLPPGPPPGNEPYPGVRSKLMETPPPLSQFGRNPAPLRGEGTGGGPGDEPAATELGLEGRPDPFMLRRGAKRAIPSGKREYGKPGFARGGAVRRRGRGIIRNP